MEHGGRSEEIPNKKQIKATGDLKNTWNMPHNARKIGPTKPQSYPAVYHRILNDEHCFGIYINNTRQDYHTVYRTQNTHSTGICLICCDIKVNTEHWK